MISVMKTKLKENYAKLVKQPTIYIVTIILWLLTSFGAFWQIMTVRAMVLRVVTRYGMNNQDLTLIMANAKADPYGKITAIFMTVIAFFVVVYGSDYHFDYAGQPKSWRLFAWTFGVQIFLFILTVVI